MEEIRQYLLSLIAAAIVCSIIRDLVESKSKIKGITNMICGVFLAITAISPWMDVRIPDVHTALDSYIEEAKDAAQIGGEGATQQMAEIIKQEVETYILDKARAYGMDLEMNVYLDAQTCVPQSVEITGDVLPYNKTLLGNYVSQTFDIPEESIKWR